MACATNFFREWLLIANGAPLCPQKLISLAEKRSVMVLDGAYANVKKAGLKIDVLLGDFDSIHAKDLIQAREFINVVERKDQSKTDLEKGIEFIDSCGSDKIIICAATSNRLQHTLFNLRLLKKYFDHQRPLVMLTDTEIIRYYQNEEIIISGQPNDSIAILGFPHGEISTSGLKYDVNHFPLSFEKSSSISNSLVDEKAEILIKGEVLVIHETTTF